MHVANSDKPVEAYNLDVVIAVGYRVKSLRGVIFRKWATSVLRQYMLKGFAVEPSRVLVSRENYLDLVNVVNRIDSTQTDLIGRVERLEDKYPEFGMRIFFKGQLYDASSCIGGILEQAHREILLIDGYVDRRTLDMLSRKRTGVSVLLYTSSKGNSITGKEISDFNAQYPSLEVRITDEFHDRFLILDRKRMYHIGASVKDAGSRTFEISENSDRRYLDMVLERLGLSAGDKV
ncbi:MAG: virulence RhuM family protein [Spirochaetales bacterium]|nr:virulence RhuM family protein [Spirochaetales bacterium]